MQRFTNKILDVANVNPELLSEIIAQGLRNGGLADSLIGEPTTSWEELLVRGEGKSPGINASVVEHQLHVQKGSPPIKQKKRNFDIDRRSHLPEAAKQDILKHNRKNMEVYVYDMLVKSLYKDQHLEDLKECFVQLKRYGMKLNLKKCVFNVEGEIPRTFGDPKGNRG
ncbi:hypothetical protein Sango_2432400 [Sesamum angolense]|uniref:Reverse transcriptase n=1 Tax=Sesamum angolense TaxID=2727404 RepID=A0AAE1W7R1_9LAMI|nr:hypothetical protein Sango_2432400 [Sesamum angolense]